MDVEIWAQAVTLLSALAALAWAVAAGPLRIHSRAAEKFIAFNLLVTTGVSIWWLLPVPQGIGAVYLIVTGMALLLTGLQWLSLGLHRLYETKPTIAVEPSVLLVFVVVLAAAAWFDASARFVVMGFFLMCIWILGLTIQQVYPMLRATNGIDAANWGLLTPVLVAVLCFVGVSRAVWMTLQSGGGTSPVSPIIAVQLLDAGQVVTLLAMWLMLNATVVSLLMLRFMDKIRDLTREDELTGALNLRSFIAMLNAERERQRRQPKRQVLLVCQIDQFQALNRQLGFEAGNMALRHATHLFVKSQRTTDRLGRSPRNEFLLFLPDTSLVGAKLVADRVQSTVKSHPLLINGQPIVLSLSIGLAERRHASLASEALIELGRHAMQQAARDGGGCLRLGPVMNEAAASGIHQAGTQSAMPGKG